MSKRISQKRFPHDSRAQTLAWQTQCCVWICVSLLLAGCQAMPAGFSIKAKPSWSQLWAKETPAKEEATLPPRYIFAWIPPGMVVDDEFVHLGNFSTRKIDLKKFTLGEEEESRTLKNVLTSIYTLERLNAIRPETLYRTMVVRRRGPLTELYPLAMVLRYQLGETVVRHRDMIGLIDAELLGLRWIKENDLDQPIGVDEINVSITGLVTQPGPVQIVSQATDPAGQSLIGLDVILETILGQDDSPIGELLATDSQGVLADWAVITRVHSEEDSMLQGLQKIVIPNPLSEQYRLEEESLEGEPSFADLGRLRIQDGDAIEMTSDF